MFYVCSLDKLALLCPYVHALQGSMLDISHTLEVVEYVTSSVRECASFPACMRIRNTAKASCAPLRLPDPPDLLCCGITACMDLLCTKVLVLL